MYCIEYHEKKKKKLKLNYKHRRFVIIIVNKRQTSSINRVMTV